MILKFRRGSTAEWVAENPVLAKGEPGFDYESNQFKIGDGVHPWTMLDDLGITGDPAALEAHIASATPHPAYDDIPSLTILFENGLV